MTFPLPRTISIERICCKPQCLTQYREHRKVLIRSQSLLDRDEGFQVENSGADSLADFHFIGKREQIRIAEVIANRGEEVDRPVTRQQVEMSAASKMAGCRPQAPFPL